MKKIFLFAFTLISILKLNAQSQCGTDELDAYLKRTNPTYAAEQQKMEQQIYSILKNKQNNPNARIAQNDCQQQYGVFTLPIVIHVMHIGEPIGIGINISDAQIIDAVRGLNERFRKVIGDGVDLEVQFALAVRDPNGNTTTGINRVNANSVPKYASIGLHFADTLGADYNVLTNLSRWPSDKYINIWVVREDDVCGAAGLDITMNYPCMTYSSGTLAHEMGHALSLHHTFAGDGSGSGLDPSTQCPLNNDCLLDGDGVCDTPPHKKNDCASTLCASSGVLENSFKNYMSYCNNNIERFTSGQKERVRTTLYGYRWNLVMSDGLMPVNTPIEVGIVSMENNLSEPICNNFIPKIKIKNTGNSTITNLKITTYVDGVLYNVSNLNTNLATNSITIYSLSNINFSSSGQHNIKFVLTEMNGSTSDFSSLNNQICQDVLVRSNLVNGYCLGFENTNNLGIVNLNSQITPPTVSNISGCNTGNGTKSLSYLSFNNNIKYFSDYFYLPYLNLDSAYQVYLVFDRSYKKGFKNTEPNISFDFLGDCDSSTIVRYGLFVPDFMVATVDGYDSINPWIPTQCSDWKKDSMDLKRFGIYNRVGGKILTKVNVYKSNNSLNKSQNLYLDNFCIHKRFQISMTSVYFPGIVLEYSHGNEIYDEGDTVTLSANSRDWSCKEFKNWTENGIIVSTNPNYKITVTKNRSLVANYINKTYNISLVSNYPSGGILTGGGNYQPNYCDTTIIIKAVVNNCYTFKYWTENGVIYSYSPDLTNVSLYPNPQNRTFIANFELKRYNITLVANPTNGGTVTGAGNFACDSSLTVKAKIKTGYKFINWTDGSTIVSTDSNYTFLISGTRSLKANFSLVTGIKQTTINEISKIYPNPANDILQIEIQSKQITSLTLNIIDMKGSLLETKSIKNNKGTLNTTFDVSKLAKGNYLLNLYDEEGMASYKFVVQ